MISSVLIVVDCDKKLSSSEFYTLVAEGLKDLEGYIKVECNDEFNYEMIGYLNKQSDTLKSYGFFSNIKGSKQEFSRVLEAVRGMDCVLIVGSKYFKLGEDIWMEAREHSKPVVVKYITDFQEKMQNVIESYRFKHYWE